jgi:hypothetical protein
MATQKDVETLARDLAEWVGRRSDTDKTLIRWLLSRCEARGLRIDSGKYVIARINDINVIDVKDAVMRALADFEPNPGDLPTTGWVRGGPIWPRAYGDWPRSYA